MSAHEHQWIFAGEVVVPTKETHLHSALTFNRLEYCITCGTLRIKFGAAWRFWYSDASKQFLSQFDEESHKVIPLSSSGFNLEPPINGAWKLSKTGDLNEPETKED